MSETHVPTGASTADVVFTPSPLSQTPSPQISYLAHAALDGPLVLCVGAGLSKAPPANLPLGANVATRLYDRLQDLGYTEIVNDCLKDDLLSIADAMENKYGDADLLQTLLPKIAEFSSARPNFSHRSLALLLLEGVIKIVSFNWDDCIERAGESDIRIQSVISDDDCLRVHGPKVLKLHGCVSREGSLLVSTRQLADPATWAANELRAQLGQTTVLFVGVGDVPSYVRIRIEQLVEDINTVDHIYVVNPTIPSVWSTIVPTLATTRRISLDSDRFLNALLNSYILIILAKLGEFMRDQQIISYFSNRCNINISIGEKSLRSALMGCVAVDIISWLRSSIYEWPLQVPVVTSPETLRGFSALSILASARKITIDPRRRAVSYDLPDSPRIYAELLLTKDLSSTEIVPIARRRISEAIRDGKYSFGDNILVLCHGQMGPMVLPSVPTSILGSEDPADIISGMAIDWLRVVAADAILEGTLPDDWIPE